MEFIEAFKKYAPFKPKYYATVYAKYLDGRQDNIKTVLEIGVQHGNSMEMWAGFFTNATIHGMDIEKTHLHEKYDELYVPSTSRIQLHLGDQADTEFLAEVIRQTGELDLIVDDGGHRVSQQIASLSFLLPYVRYGGLYIIEDLQTSYGLTNPHWGRFCDMGDMTTMKYLYGLVDTLSEGYATLTYGEGEQPSRHHISGIHFYDCIAVIEKDIR